MKSQSNEYPTIIQKLDSTSYAYNYNIQKKSNDEGTYYEFDQVIVNGKEINNNDLLREVLISNWDVNQELKLVNDFIAYQLGILTDDKYKTRYEDFLSFRAQMKDSIDKSII